MRQRIGFRPPPATFCLILHPSSFILFFHEHPASPPPSEELAALTAQLLARAGVAPNTVASSANAVTSALPWARPARTNAASTTTPSRCTRPACNACFNANTDPSVYRSGHRHAQARPVALPARHPSPEPAAAVPLSALVQAAPVTVHRDGGSDDTGYFGINIHHGGYGTTSSIGCQTIYPAQWESFFRHGQRRTHPPRPGRDPLSVDRTAGLTGLPPQAVVPR